MKSFVPLEKSLAPALLLFLTLAPLPAAALATGDLDGDQGIEAVDAAIALQIVGGGLQPSQEQRQAADVDGDGAVTLADARMILAWAAQRLGPGPQESFSRDVQLPVLATATAEVGADGGAVSLTGGTTFSVPADAAPTPAPVTLSRCDFAALDPLGNHTVFRIDADAAPLALGTLQVPYADLAGSAAATKSVDGVLAVRYDPLARTDEILSVPYEATPTGLAVPLSFLPSPTKAGRERSAADGALQTSSVYILVAEAAGIYIDSPTETKVLDVPYYRQGQYGYCWACATAGAANYVNVPDHADRPWIKPWDLAEALGVSPDSGLSLAAFRFGSSYEAFLKRKTGASVERCLWPSSTTLRLYIKKQILDHERPVVLFMPQIAHYVTIVGYEVRNGKAIVHINDSATRMYLALEWDALMALNWTSPKRFIMSTAVLQAPPSGEAPVSLHSLGHRDPTGLAFTSPFNEVAPFPDDADLKLSWFVAGTRTYGFLLNRGRLGDVAAEAVPRYYRLDLRARLANATQAPAVGKLQWKVMKSDATGQTYEGSKDFSVAARTEAEIPIRAGGFDALSGGSVLQVEAYRAAAPYGNYDNLTLDVVFDEGIRLDLNDVTGELSWTPYRGSVGQYRVYRKTEADAAWQPRATVGADVTKWTDPDFSRLAGPVSYGVAAHRADATSSIVLTSDVVQRRRSEGTAAFNFGYIDPAGPNPVSGIGFLSLATAEGWRWTSAADRALTLVGVTPSGLVLALDHDNVGDTDRLQLRDNWGLGSIEDPTGPCGLVADYEPSGDEAGLAEDGAAYFTGEEEVTRHDPYLGDYKVRERHIYRSQGQVCTALDLEDESLGESGDISPFGIQELKVSRNGSVVVFEAYSQDRLGAVTSAGGPVRWLSGHVSGDIEVSDDGSRCLFDYYDEQLGKGELATVPTAGGQVVRLEALTGLMLSAVYFGISPDGEWVCGAALQLDPEHPDNPRVGLALIRSDGSTWRWLDTGDVSVEGPVRFTPDGLAVLFPGSGPDAIDPVLGRTMDVCLLKLDGSEAVQRLTETPTVVEWDAYLQH